MTAYTTFTSGTATSGNLGVKPVTWAISIISVVVSTSGGTTGAGSASFYKYLTSTITGGTLVTPTPLRDGALAAVSTSRSGVTPTGTQTLVDSKPIPFGGSASFQPTSACIVAPGNVFWVPASFPASWSFFITITYEEMHLARSN